MLQTANVRKMLRDKWPMPDELGLSWFHQTDPRGCALFVSPQPLTDQNYSSVGVACCGEGE